MAAVRNASRKGRQRSQDPAESLINLSNERLTGLFRWTLLIFAVILNNLNVNPGYDQGRINAILAAWGLVCLTTLLLLFLHQRPGRAFSYATTGVDMLVATMITYASRSEEHTSELQSPCNLVCRLLLEKKKNNVK